MKPSMESLFDPNGDIPREILKEYKREALKKTLEGEPCRVLGEWRPYIPDTTGLSQEDRLQLMKRVSKQCNDWLRDKGLYAPHGCVVMLGHKEYPDSFQGTKSWHRDGLDSERKPDIQVTVAEEEAEEYLKLVWSDTNPTDLRVHADKTLIPTKPYEVVAVNNRLVDHKTPPNCDPRRNFLTANTVILIK